MSPMDNGLTPSTRMLNATLAAMILRVRDKSLLKKFIDNLISLITVDSTYESVFKS